MQTSWLIKHDRPACILFFAGWGMDPAPFVSLDSTGCDVLMVYDYREIFMPPVAQLLPRGYERIFLVAWSMGVWVAGTVLADCRRQFVEAVAVNGTVSPVDRRLGIDDRDFSAMIDGCTPERLEDFYQSMFDNPAHFKVFSEHQPSRPVDGVRLELENLRRSCLEYGPAEDIFTLRLVGSRDRIFPGRNQLRCWGRERCTVLSCGHFLFYDLEKWEDLMEEPGP